jgi:hypothetical protein
MPEVDFSSLSGTERETLWCLFKHGPTHDGNVPSKAVRDDLVVKGLVQRGHGYAWLTLAGVKAAVLLGMDSKKDTYLRNLHYPVIDYQITTNGVRPEPKFLDNQGTHA